MISIIVPCYNEEKTVQIFYEAVTAVLSSLEHEYEILFIDDGSSDKTLDVIKQLNASDSRVMYCSFAKNFGKEAAMLAGLKNASGDYVAVMDVDLQDPPELLPEMLAILQSGEYDSVATRRTDRVGEPRVRSWFARRFYQLINKISDTQIVDGARDFRLMKRDMVEAVIALGETNRFSKGIYSWVGFRTYWLEYEHKERTAGQSKWSFFKLTRYALDGITSFSQAPLNIASGFGILFTLIAFIALIFIIVRRAIWGDPVAGWASTICIIVFISGIQLCVLGIIGQYLAKMYLETKARPHYIIAESNKENASKIG